MVKSVLGVNHLGLREWIIQRLSALFMGVYSIVLILYLMFHPNLSFLEWRYLFSQGWMKIATILFIFLMLYHAWIGVWTIYTDYIKNAPLRLFIQTVTLAFLFICGIWGVLIITGV